jgi:hypothetical protein
MQYYTYKITFKDLPGYFYYGKHKCNGKTYLGSPVTWAHLWSCFEPEIQILQWYKTAEEAEESERSIIRATWKEGYSLNENVSGTISEEVNRKSGEKTYRSNFDPHRSKNGKSNAGVLNSRPERGEWNSKGGKSNGRRIALTKTDNGELFEFYSVCEAARVLGLSHEHLSAVARGVRKQHKGYTAVYI